MKMASQNSIFAYSDRLYAKTEEWRKAGGFKHKKPCKEWLKGKRCSHYARARYNHFKEETNNLLKLINLK